MRRTVKILPVLALLVFLTAGKAFPESAPMIPMIDERPGHIIPQALEFIDESGAARTFGSLSGRPAIITLGYFSCRKLCEDTLADLAGVLSRIVEMGERPGTDFVVLTFSFDASDTPADAARRKRDFVRLAGSKFPEGAWRFLTGSPGNIEAIKTSLGFSVKKTDGGFDHPAALVVTAPGGKIIRYLYGTRQLPMDIRMALAEASEGRSGPTIPKALLFCYSFDPGSRAYVLDALKLAGLGVLVFAAALFIYLTRSEKDRDKADRP